MSLSRLELLDQADLAASRRVSEAGAALMHTKAGTPERAQAQAAYAVAKEELRKTGAYLRAEMLRIAREAKPPTG